MPAKTGWGTYAVTVPSTAAGTSATITSQACRLKGWSLTATGAAATEADGTQAAPPANTIIANSATLPAGDYLVAWTVELEGTVAQGTDNDNFQLRANAATQAVSVNPAVAGTYPQQSQVIRLTASGTIAIRNTLAGTAGSTYRAQIVITPSAPAQALIQDNQQIVGTMGAQFGFSDTEFLDEEGIYVGTSIVVNVIQGTVSGCIYVKDWIPEEEL